LPIDLNFLQQNRLVFGIEVEDDHEAKGVDKISNAEDEDAITGKVIATCREKYK
jgi:hypothetical protein